MNLHCKHELVSKASIALMSTRILKYVTRKSFQGKYMAFTLNGRWSILLKPCPTPYSITRQYSHTSLNSTSMVLLELITVTVCWIPTYPFPAILKWVISIFWNIGGGIAKRGTVKLRSKFRWTTILIENLCQLSETYVRMLGYSWINIQCWRRFLCTQEWLCVLVIHPWKEITVGYSSIFVSSRQTLTIFSMNTIHRLDGEILANSATSRSIGYTACTWWKHYMQYMNRNIPNACFTEKRLLNIRSSIVYCFGSMYPCIRASSRWGVRLYMRYIQSNLLHADMVLLRPAARSCVQSRTVCWSLDSVRGTLWNLLHTLSCCAPLCLSARSCVPMCVLHALSWLYSIHCLAASCCDQLCAAAFPATQLC